jgi:hypothetical protein
LATLLVLVTSTRFSFPCIAAAAPTLTMPATSPPPPSPPPRPATSPPTSPQRHQQARRHHERLQRGVVSPTLRRVPSVPLPSLLPLPPPPQVSAPVTFNGQSFNHLPPHLAAAIRNLQPLPTSSRGQRAARPLSVNYLLSFFYNLSC